MKVKVTVHIFYSQYHWEEKGEYLVFCAKIDDDDSRTYVGKQEIEIEVPDNYDPRAQKVASLEKQKQKVMADYQKQSIRSTSAFLNSKQLNTQHKEKT